MGNSWLQMSDRNKNFPLCCPWPSSESEFLSLKVRSGGCGTGNSSVCGPDLIADGTSVSFTVCSRFELIPAMFVKQNLQSDDSAFGSLQTMETASGIWHEPFTHPVRSLTQVTCQLWGDPTFILVTRFPPEIKLITFLNEWCNILPQRFECHFTTYVIAGVRMI